VFVRNSFPFALINIKYSAFRRNIFHENEPAAASCGESSLVRNYIFVLRSKCALLDVGIRNDVKVKGFQGRVILS
jgi:hypothetical protein